MMKRICSVSVLALNVLLLLSIPALAATLDELIAADMTSRHIPGLSLVVVKDGRTIEAKGYGLANVELGVAATPDSVYQIGSITKPFTATAIMLLVEEGKVSLDESVLKYLPELPAAWSRITVRNALTHTSG